MRIVPENFFDRVLAADLTMTSAVAAMPVSNLQSNVRDRVWRSTSNANQVMQFDWDGDEYPVSAWWLYPGELLNANVRLQLYSDAAATVQIYDSTTLAFPSFATSGYADYAFGGDPDLGLAGQIPLVKWITEIYPKAGKLTISDGGITLGYFEASRFGVGRYADAPFAAVAPGLSLGWMSNAQHRRSRGGTLRRRSGTGRWREMRFEVFLNSEADRYEWMDLLAACDPGKEILVSLFPGDGSTRQERDHTILGSLEVLNPIALEDYNIHRLRLAVVES
jgi:hypothetical protein